MPNKELTTETRLLLAFVLVGIVLVGWNYIYKPPVTPPVTVPAPATQTAVEAPKPEPATPKIAIEVPGQVQASQAEEFTIETDLYRVRFSNQGAVVRSWILKAVQRRQREAAGSGEYQGAAESPGAVRGGFPQPGAAQRSQQGALSEWNGPAISA